jgi:hypothetical protein
MRQRYLPSLDQLSVLSALILLAYALARFVNFPGRELALQLPGIYLEVQINVHTVVAFLVAALTASGADWLIRQHPMAARKSTVEHWLLPALTAWVVGIPLFQISAALQWAIGFLVGGALLMLVLVAEYITVDPEDARQPLAAAMLTAVSYAIFLILVMGLRVAGLRLFLMMPAVSLAAWLTSLRTLHLRLHGRWVFLESGVAGFVVGQFGAAFHYLPLSPISFGLLLMALGYAITTLIAGLEEGEPLGQVLVEPLLVFVLLIGIVLWLK